MDQPSTAGIVHYVSGHARTRRCLAAVIVAVDSAGVELRVFAPGGTDFAVTCPVRPAGVDGHWHWPEKFPTV